MGISHFQGVHQPQELGQVVTLKRKRRILFFNLISLINSSCGDDTPSRRQQVPGVIKTQDPLQDNGDPDPEAGQCMWLPDYSLPFVTFITSRLWNLWLYINCDVHLLHSTVLEDSEELSRRGGLKLPKTNFTRFFLLFGSKIPLLYPSKSSPILSFKYLGNRQRCIKDGSFMFSCLCLSRWRWSWRPKAELRWSTLSRVKSSAPVSSIRSLV